MLRNPCNKLFGGIFLFINALRRRNDGFDCHTLTSHAIKSIHLCTVCGWVCTRVRVPKKMTRTNALATKKRGATRFRRKKRVETSPDKELDAVSFRLTPNMVELASRSEANKPKRRNQFSSALERKKPKFDLSKIS